ncbi:MAG: ABC transporter permease [Bryobacteraceae bacterium]|jgi:predicted permease
MRTLRRSPGFTALAVLSLALGIGANTAIFSLLYQVVLRSIPVRDPSALVWLETDDNNYGNARRDNNLSIYSYPMYQALRDRNPVLSGLVARASFSATLAARGEAEQATAEIVSGNFFEVLGVRPALGRLLIPTDDAPGRDPVVVLSYAYWMGHFGGDPNVLNQRILMNRQPVTVVGVAPRGFRSLLAGSDPDFFAPISMTPMISPGWVGNSRADYYWLSVVGRLKPGVTREQAGAVLQPLFRSILREELPQFEGITAEDTSKTLARPMHARPAAQGLNMLSARWKTPLVVLAVMVGLVLLIACANVASLLIARATARHREIAIRLAIGATRWQISRQLLVESAMLAGIGGLLGILLSQNLAAGLLGLLPADATGGWLAPQLDLRVLCFSLALSLLTGLLFGLAPALQASRSGVAPALKDQTAGMSASGAQLRTRQVLMTVQISVSLLLLIGAGLFTRSLLNLLHSDPGFRTDHLVTFRVDPALSGYSFAQRLALYHNLRDKLRALPGTQSVSNAYLLPLGGWGFGNGVETPGSSKTNPQYTACNENTVTPGYFAALGIPLLAGRDFTGEDNAKAPRVVILSEGFARFLFPRDNPIGRFVHQGMGDLDVQVVGVVKDTRINDVREKPPYIMYAPFEQGGDPFTQESVFFVRTAGDEHALMAAVRPVVKQLDRNLPVEALTSMEVTIDNGIYTDRLMATFALGFAALAAILAAVGLYGTVSYSVARRTREFGIRLVLGAAPQGLLLRVLREVGVLVLAGVAIGLPASYWLARLAESQLYGIRAHDPLTLAVATVLIVVVGLSAGLVPAVRAMRIEPIRALRHE